MEGCRLDLGVIDKRWPVGDILVKGGQQVEGNLHDADEESPSAMQSKAQPLDFKWENFIHSCGGKGMIWSSC
jgi:hypothetical protein